MTSNHEINASTRRLSATSANTCSPSAVHPGALARSVPTSSVPTSSAAEPSSTARTLDLFADAGPRSATGPIATGSELVPEPALVPERVRIPEPALVPERVHIPERVRIPVFQIRLVRERDHETELIRSPADVARLAAELVDGLDREAFYVIALSTASRVIGVHLAHLGTVDASVASPRECFKFALGVNARSIVCLHNHPSGNVEPSREDVAVSRQIQAAGEMIGIPLTDSLVVGYDGRYTSLAERGLL